MLHFISVSVQRVISARDSNFYCGVCMIARARARVCVCGEGGCVCKCVRACVDACARAHVCVFNTYLYTINPDPVMTYNNSRR